MAIWNALVARVVSWLTPEPCLRPQTCQCGHMRCTHSGGSGTCHCAVSLDGSKREPWGRCACQVFIAADDDDDDEGEDDPTPSPEELERLYGK